MGAYGQKYPDLDRDESASETGRDHIPPRVFKQMARLTKQTERLDALLSDVKFSNYKERTAQVVAFDDPHYDRKFQDLQDHQNAVCDEIALAESEQIEAQQRIENVQKNRISVERIYKYLRHFDKLYDKIKGVHEQLY